MNDKVTIQDLTDLLAAKHNMSKKDAEIFVREFFLLIEQSLENEKNVRIKGLGTFKLIDVDSRESINVNTGEGFEIKKHKKVSFTPDTNLQNKINQPFAHFESVILNENTILENTPIEEIKNKVPDEEVISLPTNDERKIQKENSNYASEEPTISEELSQEDCVISEQITELSSTEESSTNITTTTEETGNIEQLQKQQQINSYKKKENQKVIKKKKEKNAVEQYQCVKQSEETRITEQNIASLAENTKFDKLAILSPKDGNPVLSTNTIQSNAMKKILAKKKSFIFYLITSIILVLLVCTSIILFIYYPDLYTSLFDKKVLVISDTTIQSRFLADTIIGKDTIKDFFSDISNDTLQAIIKKDNELNTADNKQIHQQSTSIYRDSLSYKIIGSKAKYIIKEGETLTRISLKFYGTKAMWPYIVKHNPNVIKNPDNVPYGTTIQIPEIIPQ